MLIALGVVGWSLQVCLLDPLEQTRLTAEPIAHIEPARLRPMAGPVFLTAAWQQQLFFQRSIDARNPYYATGLTR
jgi:hypothetical protein